MPSWDFDMKPSHYRIVETPCFPCAWKVVPVSTATHCWRESNETGNYFRTQAEARQEVAKRGAKVLD